VSITSDWGTGYCANVTVTNSTTNSVAWKTTFQVQGIVKNLWNASYSQNGSEIQAQGLSWNQTAAPKSSVEFGFCADRPATPAPVTNPGTGQIQTTLSIQSDWGAGYCADVAVKNTGTTAQIWQVTLPISGTVNKFWNAKLTQQGSSISASGVSWNQSVPAKGSVSFGFCASR